MPKGGFTVRFAGDAGDGVRFLGARLAESALRAGLPVAARDDPPAEIRAPADALSGARAVTLRIGPGRGVPSDRADFVLALNGAATELFDWPEAELIFDQGRCDCSGRPGALGLPLAALTRDAGGPGANTDRDAARAVRFLVLGLTLGRFGLPLDGELAWARERLAQNPPAANAAARALRAGAELAAGHFPAPRPRPAKSPEPGELLTGPEALTRGLSVAATLAGVKLVIAAVAVPPFAEMAALTDDDPAAVALGAGRGGALGVALTAGPALGAALAVLELAVAARTPMVLVHSPRRTRGPGFPDPWGQPDLLAATRTGALVLSAGTPGELFAGCVEAARHAFQSRGPVVLLIEPAVMLAAESGRVPRAFPPIRRAPMTDSRAATLDGGVDWPESVAEVGGPVAVASFGACSGVVSEAIGGALPHARLGQLWPTPSCPPGVKRVVAVESGGSRLAELLRGAGWPAEALPLLPLSTLARRLRVAGDSP